MPVRPLNPELEEVSRNKLKEDPEKLQNALQHIKEWLAEQPHLHANTDEQWLASYIRGCFFNLETVKQKLDLYYTCRGTAPDFYKLHHKDEKFKKLLNKGFYLPLPKLETPGAPRVTLIRIGEVELTEEEMVEALCAVQIIEKIMIKDDDNSIIAGNINVVDFSGANMLLLLRLPTTKMKKLIACQQDSVPFRSFNTIYLNVPFGLDVMVQAILKGVLDEKNLKLIQTYGENYEAMYEGFVSREVLPEEYGGQGGKLQDIIDLWKEKIEQYDEWLEDDLQYRTDETKRAGCSKTAQDMFGVDRYESQLSNFWELFNNSNFVHEALSSPVLAEFFK